MARENSDGGGVTQGASAVVQGAAAVAVDLFGDPIVTRREGPGRPEHVWSAENSHKINLLFALGHDVKQAAAAIGITVPTLRKHYFSEVDRRRVAKLRLKASLLMRLNGDGSVAAIKELFKRIDKVELAQLATDVAGRGKRADKPKTVGKKDAASLAAKAVGGKFAPRPAPLLN